MPGEHPSYLGLGSGKGGTAVDRLEVRLLGAFQLTLGGQDISGTMSRKAQELLAFLLCDPQRNVRRAHAADGLWPDADAEASKKAIRQALWQLHNATNLDLPDSRRLVLTDGEWIRINPEREVWLDVTEFTAAALEARTAKAAELTEPDLKALSSAASLYQGGLLAGCGEDWCMVLRTHLEDLYLALVDKLSVAYERTGRLDTAMRWAQELLAVEPAHERSHRRLMRLLYLTDDRTRALRQFERCRFVLEQELGVRPSARTLALAAAISADNGPVNQEPREPQEPLDATSALDAFRLELAALRASVDAIANHIKTAERRSEDSTETAASYN
jgi:DNA-binding SARP family transcriptional activator